MKKIKPYRKTMINTLKGLTYLEERPVDLKERRICLAYARGGIKEERLERDLIKAEKKKKDLDYIENFNKSYGRVMWKKDFRDSLENENGPYNMGASKMDTEKKNRLLGLDLENDNEEDEDEEQIQIDRIP